MHSCISRPFVFWDGRPDNFFCEMGTDLAGNLIEGRTKGRGDSVLTTLSRSDIGRGIQSWPSIGIFMAK